MLSLAITYPLPEKKIKAFAEKVKGKLFVIEDGYRFLEEKVRLLGIEVTGKDELSTVTNWTPEDVLEYLSKHVDINYKPEKKKIDVQANFKTAFYLPGMFL